MESVGRDPKNIPPLTRPMFYILLALVDGERHGYSIMQEIASQTGGNFHIGPTTLYRSIKRMLDLGMIVETDERPDPDLDDERRRYYRLTMLGLYAARMEKSRLSEALAVANEKGLDGEISLSPACGGA